MSVFKSALLVSCLLLSACQTTSIRELSKSEPNKAQLAQQKSSGAIKNDYPIVQEDHLRMYVFTSFEQANEKQTARDGYFIDFKVKKKPIANEKNIVQTNFATSPSNKE